MLVIFVLGGNILLKPRDISEKRFEKSKMFGYKISEVDGFIAEILKDYETLYNAKSELESKVNFLADKLSEYRDQENKLTDVLLEAKKVSDNIIKKAKEKAEVILSKTEDASQKLVVEAKNEAERQQTLFLKLQKETTTFKNKLLSLYKLHIDLISNLPSSNLESEENSIDAQKIVEQENSMPDVADEKRECYNKNLKERTFSISLDKNGRPIEVKDETLSDTKSISLLDLKNASQKDEKNGKYSKSSKFKEPLKFGASYNLNGKTKK